MIPLASTTPSSLAPRAAALAPPCLPRALSSGPPAPRRTSPLAFYTTGVRRASPLSRLAAAAMALPPELASIPGVAPERPPETKGFVFQQTMLRVRDPEPSLRFYTDVLGMTLVLKLDFPDMAFSLYFLAFVDDPSEIPAEPKARAAWVFRRPAVLELTHNYGTEKDADFPGYKSGNEAEAKGFGHIGLSVPDVGAACKRFEEKGVAFVKRPDDGKMKGLAFIKDPDGYWIEILNADTTAQYAK